MASLTDRAAREFRRPPLHHGDRSGGVCRWCGLPVLHPEGAKAGQLNRRRAWHPECVEIYKLHGWPEVQFAFVRKRDGAKCFQCGAKPKKWLAARRESVDRVTRGRYVRVKRVTALELDHTVPLWSVSHLPADERRPFHGPDNLRLLCPACHQAKTVRETAARAERRRIFPVAAQPGDAAARRAAPALMVRKVMEYPDPHPPSGDPEDKQSLYIEAAVQGVLIASIYLSTAIPSPGASSTTSWLGSSG